MKRAGLMLFLIGVAMVMSSCVPVGYTLIDLIFPDPLDQKSLALSGDNEVTLQVPAKHNTGVRVALRVSFAADDDDDNTRRSARYYYRVFSSHGTQLQHGSGQLDYASSTTRIGPKKSEERWTTYEKVFEEIKPIPGDPLAVEVTLEPKSLLSRAQVRLYGPKPAAKISMLSAMVLWVLGIILALTGGLLWMQTLSTTPDAGRAQSAQMALDLEQGIERESAATPHKDERIWAMVCHLTIFSAYLIIPFGHLLGPLLVWLAKRERSYYLDWHGREALNFNFSITLYALAGLLICLTIIGLFVGLMVLFMVLVLHVSATLYMAIRAQQGDWARYPFSIRFLSPPRRAQNM